MRRDSSGMALPLVLILLLALTAFGHAALVLSQREVQASSAYRDVVRAEKAAGVGLRLALSLPVDPGGARPPWVAQPLLAGDLADGLTYSVTRRWIDGEFFVLQGKGSVKGWPGETELEWVGWTLAPGARLTSFLAASEVGSEIRAHESSTLSTGGLFSDPAEWPTGLRNEVEGRGEAILWKGPLPGVIKEEMGHRHHPLSVFVGPIFVEVKSSSTRQIVSDLGKICFFGAGFDFKSGPTLGLPDGMIFVSRRPRMPLPRDGEL